MRWKAAVVFQFHLEGTKTHGYDPETLNDPQAFQKFQQAQGELSSALSRLLVVSERYPDLKANQSFRDLRVQLEGTENRITVARNRYIQAVQEYNVLARSFPNNLTAMVFHYQPKPNFSVSTSQPPTLNLARCPSSGRVSLRSATASNASCTES